MASAATAASNVRWVGIAQGGRVGVQVVSLIVLSRLLPAADFGLMAMAAVVMNFANLFRDMGTSAALIQRRELTKELLDTVFWLNVAFGILLGGCVAAAAPAAAWVFSAATLTGVMLGLAPVFPIAATSAPHLALLERDNRFRAIARIEITSAGLGLSLAVAAALLGAGVYAFVVQAVTTATASAVQLWGASTWRPGTRWSRSELRDIWGLSGNIVAFNFMNYFVRNGDSFLVGRFLGPVSLGWYSVANRLLLFPLQNLTFVMHRALLPIYSRRQDNTADVAALYLKSLSLIAMVSAPAMFGLWAIREPLITALLGAKWLPVIGILTWFAPMGFFQSLNSTSGTILTAIGRTDLLRMLGVLNAIIILCAFLSGLQFGLIGLAVAYFFATVIVTLISLCVTLGKVGSRLDAALGCVAAPVLCAAAMGSSIAGLNALSAPLLTDVVRLPLLVSTGVAIYTGLLLVFAKSLVQEFRTVLLR
jgi:PST family polysaccharide transporter